MKSYNREDFMQEMNGEREYEVQRRGSYHRRMKTLSVFGHCYYFFCHCLGVSGAQLADEAGVASGTYSKVTRIGTQGIAPDTVSRLWLAIERRGQAQGFADSLPAWKRVFYTTAGLATEEERAASERLLNQWIEKEGGETWV